MHARIRRHALVRATVAALTVLAVLPAAALADDDDDEGHGGAAVCEVPAGTPVFAPFGDLNDYYLAAGGSFEGGLSWASGGKAQVVAESDPYLLAGPNDRSSVRIERGGFIRSARFCITPDTPHLRFMAKNVSPGQLDVRVDSFSPDGGEAGSSSGSISMSDHADWAPTRMVTLDTGGLQAGQHGWSTLTIRVSGGVWLVDDVFIDPYRRG